MYQDIYILQVVIPQEGNAILKDVKHVVFIAIKVGGFLSSASSRSLRL